MISHAHKVAHKRKKHPPKHTYNIEYKYYYYIYDDKYFDCDDIGSIEAIKTSEDPFYAHWRVFASLPPGHTLGIRISKYKDGVFLFAHTICKTNLKGTQPMKIEHEHANYNTSILYTDAPSEFFPNGDTRKFHLWEVTHNKRVGYIVDFTTKYDSTMILSLFGNRLRMRLDKGPNLVESARATTLCCAAHFAIVWENEKNKFF